MTAIRQAVCYPILHWPGEKLDELFARLAEIGYGGVECWQAPEDLDALVAQARAHGLEFVSMVGHRSLGEGMNDRSHGSRQNWRRRSRRPGISASAG